MISSRGELTMEHRCGLRRETQLTVTLRTRSGLAVEGAIRNISASGALIASPLPTRLNGELFVQFERAGVKSPNRRIVVAEVVRHVPGGFAVEWAEFSSAVIRGQLRELGQASLEVRQGREPEARQQRVAFR
jgi:hypothetical protein